jgi:hypothetical protein
MHTGSSLGRRAKLTGTRVLVVEDEIFASMLVEDELRDAGATVLGPAPSVGDALRLVEAAAADGGISAAVLDIDLMGGTWRRWPTGWPRSACRSCSPRVTARTTTRAGTGQRRPCPSHLAPKG